MDRGIRELVRRRAGNRCEYCRLPQAHTPFLRHQIEHVLPRKHGGLTTPENLALAYIHCNLCKGSNLSGIDQQSRQIVPLFHPRRQTWTDHFAFSESQIIGLTSTGRATVAVMNMNDAPRLRLRAQLAARGQSE